MTDTMDFVEALRLMSKGEKVESSAGIIYRLDNNELRYTQPSSSPVEYWCFASVNELLANKYTLWQEPGHDWAWALEQLEQGHKITRKAWTGGVWYWYKKGCQYYWGNKHEVSLVRALEENVLEATDWILV